VDLTVGGGGASFGSGPGIARGSKLSIKQKRKKKHFGIKIYPYTID
jgi:hypothetical protein